MPKSYTPKFSYVYKIMSSLKALSVLMLLIKMANGSSYSRKPVKMLLYYSWTNLLNRVMILILTKINDEVVLKI